MASSLSKAELVPTPEQEKALHLYRSRQDFKLVAVAGSGKTTTLRLMAESFPRRHIAYLAFNRAMKEEARRKFPPNTRVFTLHALAYRRTVPGTPYEAKFRLGNGQVRPVHVRERLQVDPLLAYVVRSGLERFIRSGDPEPLPRHLPRDWRKTVEARGPSGFAEVERAVKGVALLWKAMRDPKDPFPLSHDGYVRIWREEGAGGDPPAGVILVDEAQDLDPNFLTVLSGWRGKAQQVFVGDPRQQIYGWRGAVNAMGEIDLPESPLTWSFRFGEPLASFVQAVTARQTQGLVPLVGRAGWATEVHVNLFPTPPFTILTRSNLGLVTALLEGAQLFSLQKEEAHVVGGVEELVWLLTDLQAIKEGGERPRPHPELLGISKWEEVESLAEYSIVLNRLLRLAKEYDLEALAHKIAQLHGPEEGAKLVLSTAHKAKGREWDRVLLWEDFYWVAAYRWFFPNTAPPPSEPSPEFLEEENIFYVAMTRARLGLHISLPEALAEEEAKRILDRLSQGVPSGEDRGEGERGETLPAPFTGPTPVSPKEATFPLPSLYDRLLSEALNGGRDPLLHLLRDDLARLSALSPTPLPPEVAQALWERARPEEALGAIREGLGAMWREDPYELLRAINALALLGGRNPRKLAKILGDRFPGGEEAEDLLFVARARKRELMGRSLAEFWRGLGASVRHPLLKAYARARS